MLPSLLRKIKLMRRLRGASPLFLLISSPSPLKERGIKGVRLIDILLAN